MHEARTLSHFEKSWAPSVTYLFSYSSPSQLNRPLRRFGNRILLAALIWMLVCRSFTDLVEELRFPERVNHFVKSRAGYTSLQVMGTRANRYLQRGSPLYKAFVDALELHMQDLKGLYHFDLVRQ
jgi:hypothetical protein